MSKWFKSPFPIGGVSKHNWPIDSHVDPWWGDESIIFPACHDTHKVRTAKPLSATDFQQQDVLFIQAYQQLLSDPQTSLDIIPIAQSIGLQTTLQHDQAARHQAHFSPSNQLLAALCEDRTPDIGTYATERVFGPFAQHLQNSPFHTVLAAAVLFLSPTAPHSSSPAGRACEDRPKLPAPLRMSIMAIAKSPVLLWKILPSQHVQPLLPISTQFCPKQIVKNLPNSPMMIARIAWTPTPQAYCVQPISAIPVENIFYRLWLEWLRVQRHTIKICWEDILRFRAELLYRSVGEYLYNPQKDETCLLSY